MRLLVLFAPRLGIQLLRRHEKRSVDRALALATGEADSRLISVVSREATLQGVEPGMTVAQAQQRSPGIVVEPDNARECLDTLERLKHILASRATTNVAIVSRNAIALTLAGLERQFANERDAAHFLLTFARAHSNLDLRAGVASSVAEAVCAAKSARRFPVVREADDSESQPLQRYEPVSVSAEYPSALNPAEAQAKLVKIVATMQPLLDVYEQSYRSVSLERTSAGQTSKITLRPAQPVHRAAEALECLRLQLAPDALDGVTRLGVTLGMPGPAVNVEPWRAPTASFHEMTAPARPIQRRLLRAS